MRTRVNVYRVYGVNGSRFCQDYDSLRQARAAIADLISDKSGSFRYGIERITYVGSIERSRKILQFA